MSKRLCLAISAAIVGLALIPSLAGATVGTPKYPNLRAMPPTDLMMDTVQVDGQDHHFLRFTSRTFNAGPGALELQRVPQAMPAAGLADLNQRVYEDPAGFRDIKLGTVSMESTFTFVVPAAATYQLWTQRDYDRAARTGFKRGSPLYTSPGVEYCVDDSEEIVTGQSQYTYASCTAAVMGISAGWADREDYYNEWQNFDFGTSPLPDGLYVLRAIVDPDNVLWESEGKADPAKESQVANSAVTQLEVNQGVIAWNDPVF